MKRSEPEKGFTLIELLIVVAIIGILAAIAIPNLLTALQKSRQKRSMGDMRTIGSAWEARATDVNGYNAAASYDFPPVSITFPQLTSSLSPTYVRGVPQYDGWHSPFQFTATEAMGGSTRAQEYGIRSVGADHQASGVTYTEGVTTDFDCDIIYANGRFVVYPEGIQRR